MSHSFYGVDHVQLAGPVGCEDEARRFFGDILGMKEIEKPDTLKPNGGLWLQCGSHQILIGVDKNFVPAKKAHPAIHVQNVTSLKERILSHGFGKLLNQRRACLYESVVNR